MKHILRSLKRRLNYKFSVTNPWGEVAAPEIFENLNSDFYQKSQETLYCNYLQLL